MSTDNRQPTREMYLIKKNDAMELTFVVLQAGVISSQARVQRTSHSAWNKKTFKKLKNPRKADQYDVWFPGAFTRQIHQHQGWPRQQSQLDDHLITENEPNL